MRTQSRRLAPSDSAISFILRKACRMRASSPCTSVLVLGSMPRMPATKTKSPARVPRFHVPVVLMAPSGASVLTPWGEDDWANTAVAAPINMVAATRAKPRMQAPPSCSLCLQSKLPDHRTPAVDLAPDKAAELLRRRGREVDRGHPFAQRQ